MKYVAITLLLGTFLILSVITITAQCPAGRIKSTNKERKGGTIGYKIPENTKFYIKMDNAINSETFRAGDVVSFTVIEDVYGEFIDYKEKEKKEEIPYAKGDIVKVISKDSKGFGRVNYSQRPTLFYVGGKSKIYVVPEYILLGNGKCLSIELPAPDTNTLYFSENVKPCKYQEKNLKIVKNERKITKTNESDKNDQLTQCIQGRRPKVFNSGIAKAAATGILAGLDDDSNSDRLSIGTLTILSEGAGVDGIVDLLAGKNAEISNLLIFEVKLSDASEGYIEYSPKKEEKKD